MSPHSIGIIGYGNVGRALGGRLSREVGPVSIGVRDPASPRHETGADAIRVASVAETCDDSDVIFLAVPAEEAVASLRGAGIAGRIVVDCTNPLKWIGRPVWDPPGSGSMTAELAHTYPEARWMKGFATFGSAFHADPDLHGEGVDVHLAGDDEDAKRIVSAIAESAGFHPVDAGPLENAALLEAMAILWIHLARPEGGFGKNFAFQIRRR